RITDHPAAIAIGGVPRLFERYGPCFQRELVSRVGVVNIKVEKCRHRFAWANAAYHDKRIANSDHRRPIVAEFSSRAKCAPEKLNLHGCVLDHQPRRYAVPAFGNRFRHGLTPSYHAAECSSPR